MLFPKTIIVTSQIVNLTGRPFNMYEESSGNIYTLIPSSEDLPMDVSYGMGRMPKTYYVVNESELSVLQRKNRTLADIAFIYNEGDGYAKIRISSLASADNPRMSIKLRRNYKCYNTGLSTDDSRLYVRIV